MGIFGSGINKAAYQGELTCPYVVNGVPCESKAIRYLENINPYLIRYRCRKCGGAFQYDISNRTDLNPYANYQKGRIWKEIDRILSGRKLKGALK